MATSNAGGGGGASSSSADVQMISADTTGKRMITLRSNDNESFEVEENFATQLGLLKILADDGFWNDSIPLPNVSGAVLRKVIDYCKLHAEAKEKMEAAATAEEKRLIDDDLKRSDQEFVKQAGDMVFDLALAAHYLHNDGLVGLTCQAIANMMNGMSTEEMRKMFNVENDFTPLEEEAVRNEDGWAYKD